MGSALLCRWYSHTASSRSTNVYTINTPNIVLSITYTKITIWDNLGGQYYCKYAALTLRIRYCSCCKYWQQYVIVRCCHYCECSRSYADSVRLHCLKSECFGVRYCRFYRPVYQGIELVIYRLWVAERIWAFVLLEKNRTKQNESIYTFGARNDAVRHWGNSCVR